MKKRQYESKGGEEYRKAYKRFQNAQRKANEDWISTQCEKIETCLKNKQQQDQLMTDLTSSKHDRSTTSHKKVWKMSNRRTRASKQMDRIMLKAIQSRRCVKKAVMDFSQH